MAPDLSDAQRRQLVDLIALYVGNMDDGHAKVRMSEVQQHLPKTSFAWIGRTEPSSVFYYRIQSPSFSSSSITRRRRISASSPRIPTCRITSTSTSSCVRPNGNDYGKDLLRQHYAQHRHTAAYGVPQGQ